MLRKSFAVMLVMPTVGRILLINAWSLHKTSVSKRGGVGAKFDKKKKKRTSQT